MDMAQIEQLHEKWRMFLRSEPGFLKNKSDELHSLLRDFRYAGRRVNDKYEREQLQAVAAAIAGTIGKLTRAMPPSAMIDTYEDKPRFRLDVDGLPPKSSLFLGRGKEMKLLTEALDDPTSRFVQITGAGGQGKTQLVNHWISWLEEQSRVDIEAAYCHTFYTFPSHSFKKVPDFIAKAHRFFLPDRRLKSLDKHRPLELAWAVGAGPIDVGVPLETFSDIGIQVVEKIAGGSGKRILILDGLEACLRQGKGDFTDQAKPIETLLNALMELSNGFCIVTSRRPLDLLEDLAEGVVRHIPLSGLADDDGAEFLNQLGVQSTEPERRRLSQYLGGHPLALLTFGDMLVEQANGKPHLLSRVRMPVSVRDLIEKLDEGILEAPFWREVDDKAWDAGVAEHKSEQRLMGLLRSYLRYFETIEPHDRRMSLEFIRLLAFFQGPASLVDLQVLIRLEDEDTRVLNGYLRNLMDERDVNQERLVNLVCDLKDRQLLQTERSQDAADQEIEWVVETHPLLRSLFRQQLMSKAFHKAWQKGHAALASHYLNIKSDQEWRPETEYDFQLHYRAVEHACQAGKWHQAYNVYWKSIHRNLDDVGEDQYQWYAWEAYGMLGEDIRALSWFYRAPESGRIWQSFEGAFQEQSTTQQKIHIRAATGLCLLNLGYIDEAGDPLSAAYQAAEPSDHLTASMLAGLMGDRYLVQGELQKAEDWIIRALNAAKKSGEPAQLRSKYAKVGNLNFCRGEWGEAHEAFEEMLVHHEVRLRDQPDSGIPGHSGTRSGFYYSDFLLSCAAWVLNGLISPSQLGFEESFDRDARRWALEKIESVRERAEAVLNGPYKLSRHDQALNRLAQARAGAEIAVFDNSGPESAREGLEKSLRLLEDISRYQEEMGRHQDLPLTLLVQAHVLRHLHRWDDALQTLDAALRITGQGEMKLYECDTCLVRCAVYHDLALEAEGDENDFRRYRLYCLDTYHDARLLYNSMRYRKRLLDLYALREMLTGLGVEPEDLGRIDD